MLNSQSTQVLLNKYLQPIWWRLDVDVVVVVVVVAVVVVVVVIVVRSLLRFCKNLFSKESKSKKFPVKNLGRATIASRSQLKRCRSKIEILNLDAPQFFSRYLEQLVPSKRFYAAGIKLNYLHQHTEESSPSEATQEYSKLIFCAYE